MQRRGYSTGFSLIELLVVVAVILAITAIAIPQFLQAKIRANEAVAVANMRTLVSAEALYSTMYPQLGFAPDIASMSGSNSSPLPGAAGLVDGSLAVAGHGYLLSITPKKQDDRIVGYHVYGRPTLRGVTGRRAFCADEAGVITYSNDGADDCSAPVPF
jgi:prepilin-type N-terminal cleavage/methylation domain-containing protein